MKTRVPAPPPGDRKNLVQKRALPPVSAERGGLKPGIDIEHPSELLEIDDLAEMKRLYNLHKSRARPR
jgi:hypothetical protein